MPASDFWISITVMAHAVINNSDTDTATATGAAIDAALRVGRGADNDVVLDHPTVSRHHAVIERANGQFFITDLGSRNATRVNGRTVRERRPLATGDKIRFGQVRVTFVVVGNDANATPSLEQFQTTASPSGIVFNCVCGVCLWAKDDAVTGVVTCRKCHVKIVVPAESTNADSGETVAGLVFSVVPETLSAPVPSGTCSICQWPTNTEDVLTTCPACGLTFHAQCWTENRGCSAYGCAQVNAIIVGRGSEVGGGFGRPPFTTDHPPPAPRAVSVGHAMLAASIAGGVLGLLAFGTMALIVLIASLAELLKRRRTKEMKLLLIAAGVSALGVVVGGLVSSMVWLEWTPGGMP